MQNVRNVDVLIVGGGPAGLAAALRLWEKGIRNILLVEREKRLGGILRQCIHDGFGLARFGESLSGPEYAGRFTEKLEEYGIPFLTDAAVYQITPEKIVTVVTKKGLLTFQTKAVILAMGCRERTQGALAIPGERPAGVFTAGTAQAYMNLYNRMPAREVVILGSGDIGLIMARRLTLEGAHVHAVFEIQPYPSGLARNLQQCLRDYGIPLYLSHTVTEIHGSSRLEGVTVSEVDEHLRPVPGTEQYIACDTLILSAGLIPENELSLEAGVILDPRTKGAVVDEHLQTSVPGIYAAGNVLHVHDLADYVSEEAELLADAVVSGLQENDAQEEKIPIRAGEGIHHTVPQKTGGREPFLLSFRVTRPMQDVEIVVRLADQVLLRKRRKRVVPAEMLRFPIQPFLNAVQKSGEAEVESPSEYRNRAAQESPSGYRNRAAQESPSRHRNRAAQESIPENRNRTEDGMCEENSDRPAQEIVVEIRKIMPDEGFGKEVE
ncbi:MAG: FAD-dependent oxidoreductase [Blautia sp.]|nr:FAD-dependent oxidoreductase [Blautia sp.]